MDAAYDPEPTLNVSPRPMGGAGPVRCAARILRLLDPPTSRAHPEIAPSPPVSRRSYATVILRAVCACREPSLSPRESIQWASYVVVKIMARLARAHPHPAVFEPLVVGMASLRVGRWRPARRAVAWLLLAELQREPESEAARWASRLANDIATGDGDGDGDGTGDGDGDRDDAYSTTLLGEFSASTSVALETRRRFGAT
jgi:hypothetical protein